VNIPALAVVPAPEKSESIFFRGSAKSPHRASPATEMCCVSARRKGTPMQEFVRRTRRQQSVMIVGVVLLTALGIQCTDTEKVRPTQAVQIAPIVRSQAAPQVIMATVDEPQPSLLESMPSDPNEALLQSEPLEFFRQALAQYEEKIHDYRCTFRKLERVDGEMREEETSRVLFREKPHSVLMSWDAAPRPAQRVLFIDDKWVNDEGEELALVHPEPVLALLVPRTKQPIHGAMARSKGRRTIDQFGFGQSLRLIISFSEEAKKTGQLGLEYVGRSSFEGRPTYVIERRLPYTDESGFFPERKLVIHMDEEWLLPTCVIAYADDEEQQLLGRYLITDVQFNSGLSDRDFQLD
jgi:hypothetical protein